MRTLARLRGFTLLELLLVIVLIGISVGAVSVAVGRGLKSANERHALTQLVQTLRAARVQAITTGQPALARFDLGTRQFVSPRRSLPLPPSMQVKLQTADGLGAAFEFYPDGGASGGYMALADNDRHWRIDINWLTGAVQLRVLN
jgi:general secretion pathway protein H